MVEAVVSGGFRESMRVPLLLGDGWRESEFQFNDDYGGFRRSQSRVRRSRALEITGGERQVTLDVEALAPTQRDCRAAPVLEGYGPGCIGVFLQLTTLVVMSRRPWEATGRPPTETFAVQYDCAH